MSRKNKHQKPVDTGGLNLQLPVEQTPPAEEPAIDVNQDITSDSRAHMAMEELESLPPATDSQPITGDVTDENGAVIGKTIGYPYKETPGDQDHLYGAAFEGGMGLYEALSSSPFLHLAVRKTNNPSAYMMSNGQRFWTVEIERLEAVAMSPFENDGDARVGAKVWRPVAGSERGWHVVEVHA